MHLRRGVIHGHFIVNHSINPRHDQTGVQCAGVVRESMNGEAVLILVLRAGAAAVGFVIGYSF